MRSTSLRTGAEFRRAFLEGTSAAGKYVVVHAVPNGLQRIRTGFPVGKRMGSAVRRNRIRRLLREAVRTSQAIPRSGYDIVIVPRQAVSDRDVNVQAVLDDLDRVIARMGLREGTGD